MRHTAFEDTFAYLPQLAGNSYDMIIADPPYDFSESQKQELHSQFVRLCKGTIVVYSPPENQWIRPADQYLFWIKPISTKNTSLRYSRFIEMLFLYQMGETKRYWIRNRHWSQYTNVFTDLVDERHHPHRKPPSQIERLILNHTRPGDTILDPFMGSGVVGDMAERTGRNTFEIGLKTE